ncbi:MAG TPA: AraC family transcriptional regulator [Usitatibacter sp.]|nr:AraC family transcriptional regulator [Usitatibacter sp.]
MNEPATSPEKAMSWKEGDLPPRWYLWEGGFLVTGRAGGEVPVHAHHTIQVHVATEGAIAVRAVGGEWQVGRGTIVRADVEHAFDARGATGAMLMVDPESSEGAHLQHALASDITIVPDARLESPVAELRKFIERPMEAMEAGALVRHTVQTLCPQGLPLRKLDRRVGKVLDAIRQSEELRLSLEDAAELVHLSPGRFQHLFKEEVGLPFRRYVLWRKLTRAMLSIGRERTLAAAAQQGDFSDAAHLTRTFHQMFGIPPSVLMRGEFFEIASPF